MADKTFTIIKHRKGTVTEQTGTLDELTEHFSYTLESGRSYDSKVSLKPKSAQGLVSALNRATDSLQRGSFNPNLYQLKEA